jgi:hypothetical protein
MTVDSLRWPVIVGRWAKYKTFIFPFGCTQRSKVKPKPFFFLSTIMACHAELVSASP